MKLIKFGFASQETKAAERFALDGEPGENPITQDDYRVQPL